VYSALPADAASALVGAAAGFSPAFGIAAIAAAACAFDASAPDAPAVAVAPAAPLAAGAALAAGAGNAPPALYTQVCSACHATGVAGAPKLGDKAAWAPRMADGIDGMTAIAIKGKGAMPPRGGTTASDADIKAVVTYMANAAK